MNKVPIQFKKYFWDTDIKNIDPKKHSKYIIARLLDKGDRRAIRYVINNFSKETIAKTIKTSRDLSPRSANFWATLFNIDKKGVARLQRVSTKTPAGAWLY